MLSITLRQLEVFKHAPQSIAEMGLLLYAADQGFIKDVAVDKIGDFETALLSYMHSEHGELMNNIVASGDYNDKTRDSQMPLRRPE